MICNEQITLDTLLRRLQRQRATNRETKVVKKNNLVKDQEIASMVARFSNPNTLVSTDLFSENLLEIVSNLDLDI